MNITVGTKLGSYEIISRVGAGGMGEVWRARDPRIGRDVAIKVLPASFTDNEERLRRFEQEARAAGTLNHPNLVTVHELGTSDGSPFIAMELLEGATLREKLHEGGTSRTLPLRKAMEYAAQLATGLAAAHERGVVHRDLKPENIFITSDGRVKILDFGLAKLCEPKDVTGDEPTEKIHTEPGVVMGTPGYMSPEQVRGSDIDARSDIFSFGGIAYEMLTGQRAFQGQSSVETMNAILHRDPPEFSASGQQIPAALERIIRRCLEKDRAERFHSARDVAFALEAIGGSLSSAQDRIVSPDSFRIRKKNAWLLASLVGAFAILLATAAYYFRPSVHARTDASTFVQLTYDAGVEREPALSADGKTFAFVRSVDGQHAIFAQRVDGQSAIKLTKGNNDDDSQPAFSPDGSQIAFRSERNGGGIFVMGTAGESVRRLTDDGFNPAWSPDGREIVYASESVSNNPRSRRSISSLSVVTIASGATRLLYKGDAVQPRWSPNGRRIAFWSLDVKGYREIRTIAASGNGEAASATDDPSVNWNPVWSPDGRLIYFLSDRNGTMNLWQVAIEPDSGAPRGRAESVSVPAIEVAFLSTLSNDGRLLYQTSSSRGEVRHVTLDVKSGTIDTARRAIFDGSKTFQKATMSPDGDWVAFTTAGRQEDLFVMRTDGTDVRQLTDDLARDRGVTWWPDGSRILFYSMRDDGVEAWSIRPDGSGLTQLTRSTGTGVSRLLTFPTVSPDGSRLAFFRLSLGGRVLTLGGANTEEALPPLPGSGGAFWPRHWSPNGRRILGTRWEASDVSNGLYAYSLETKTYELLDPKGRIGQWIDESTILVVEGDGRVSITDLSTRKTRDVGKLDVSTWPRTFANLDFSAQARDLVYATTSTEGDIWGATIGDPAQPGR